MGVISIIGIERHHLEIDGKGVSSLVGIAGCPLQCKYCLNPQCKEETKAQEYSPQSLYDALKVDDLYFQATGGGVTFGGGEPCLQSDFICAFRKLIGKKWSITVETSLNVEPHHVIELLPIVDEWIVDIKDMNEAIYKRYSGTSNQLVSQNLKILADKLLQSKTIIRVPRIPFFNTEEHVGDSIQQLKNYGFSRFDIFEYKTTIPPIAKIDTHEYQKDEVNEGKFVCEVLKEIRKTVVEANHLDFVLNDCPNNVCSTGSCPLCDNEAKQIMNRLYVMKQNGLTIKI